MSRLSQTTLLTLGAKNIVVLGVGLTGLSCVRYLHANNIAFAVNDSRDNPIDALEFSQRYDKVKLILGHWDLALLGAADILLVSPGIDLDKAGIKKVIKADCQIWGDVELYCRLTDTPILAVTGSNGKSTVVSLLTHLGQALGYKAELGGNVGLPVLDHLTRPAKNQLEMLVLELSSFQLESLSSMKAIAATVLNVSDDHLDRHLTMDNYQAIKQSIYQQCQISVINRDDKRTFCHNSSGNARHANAGQVISFGSDSPQQGHFGLRTLGDSTFLMFGEQPLMALDALPLAGLHNALNYLAALALGHCAAWPLVEMVEHLSEFKGLTHRCQRVNSRDDIHWVNDSKATNVGATLAAINGLAQVMKSDQQLILIAGGEGKGADFSPLKSAISEHVQHLITLGKDGDEIAAFSKQSIKVSSIEQAVLVAKELANANDTVLLSPACASLDMFKNFAARGQAFIDAVQQIAGGSE